MEAVAAGIPLRPAAGMDLPLRQVAEAIAHPLLPTAGAVVEAGTAGGESRCQVSGVKAPGTRHLRPFLLASDS